MRQDHAGGRRNGRSARIAAQRGSLNAVVRASVATIALLAAGTGPAWADSFASGAAAPASVISVSVDSGGFDASLLPPPPAAIRTVPPAPAFVAPSAPSRADSAPPAPPQDFSRWGGREWMLEKRTILGDAPDMIRYVANECVLAGVAGAAIAVALTVSGGAVGPVAAAALGVSPEMSTMGITALGCVAGAAAGVASAVAIYAYEEPETVRDFAVASAQGVQSGVQYVASATAETVAAAVTKPQEALVAAASGAQWVVAGVASSVSWGVSSAATAVAGATQATAGAIVTAAAAGIGAWWPAGQSHAPVNDDAFDVASAPMLTDDHGSARVY